MGSSEDLDPYLIRQKQSRLIDAVRHNNVELLKELLDSPKWYNVTNREGYNLLQITIHYEKKEVFDYLLSLPDYPLDVETKFGETTLELSLSPERKSEYFALELIKKVSCIEKMCCKSYTLLHYACVGGFVKASRLLIEKGIDVNAPGFNNNSTPLHTLCQNRNCDLMKCIEIIDMLLEFGADTSVRNYFGCTPFENSVIMDLPNEVQEVLFYYTYDEFSLLEIHLEILMKLAAKNSFLFHEITKRQCEVIVKINVPIALKFFQSLNHMNIANLKTVITKFEKFLEIFFARFAEFGFGTMISYEKLIILLESNLKYQIINIIPRLTGSLYNKINHSEDEAKLTEYICFLLSYGMEIDENCLYLIYKKFGYCDLFKILLHMDIIKENSSSSSYIFPRLLIYITENLEDILNNTNDIPSHELLELMSYFANPKLHFMYRQAVPAGSINAPKIPSLLELSRNVFRSYFINKFHIKTSSQFYTLLNSLEISSDYKKIISYETKLYSP